MRIIRKSAQSTSPIVQVGNNIEIEKHLHFFIKKDINTDDSNNDLSSSSIITRHFFIFLQRHAAILGITIASIIALGFLSFHQLHASQITRLFFTPDNQSFVVSRAGSTTLQAEVESDKQIIGIQVWANISGTIPDTITLTPYAVSGMDLIINQLETTETGKTIKLVFLVPPTSSFTTVSDTLSLADIDVIANQAGQMTISFDPIFTKILEYNTSVNLIDQLSAGSMTFLSPTPTPTPKPTHTPVPTATPTFTPSPTITNTPTPTPTIQPEPTSTPLLSSTPIPTNTPFPTATPTPTSTLTISPSFTPTSTPTILPDLTPSTSPTITATPNLSPSPTLTPTPELSLSPIPSPTSIPTFTPTPTSTITPITTSTLTPTNQPEPTSTPTSAPTTTPITQATSTPKTPTATPINLLLEEEKQGNILGIFDTKQNRTATLNPIQTPTPTKGAVNGITTEAESACENQLAGFAMILGALFLLLLLIHIFILSEFSLMQIGMSFMTVIASTTLITILDCQHQALLWFFISLMVLGGEFLLKWVVEMLIGE